MAERVMCVWPGRDGPVKIHAQKPGAHRWEPDPMCGVRINADWAEYQAMDADEVDCERCRRCMKPKVLPDRRLTRPPPFEEDRRERPNSGYGMIAGRDPHNRRVLQRRSWKKNRGRPQPLDEESMRAFLDKFDG